jgi:hypothetical protein
VLIYTHTQTTEYRERTPEEAGRGWTPPRREGEKRNGGGIEMKNKDLAKFAKRIESLCNRYGREFYKSRGMGSSATYYIDVDGTQLRVSGHDKTDSTGFNYNTDEWSDIIKAVAAEFPLKAVDKAFITKAVQKASEKFNAEETREKEAMTAFEADVDSKKIGDWVNPNNKKKGRIEAGQTYTFESIGLSITRTF